MSQMPTPTFVSTLLFRIELTFWKKGFIGSSKRSWRSWKNSLVVVFMHFESNIPSSIPVSVYLFHENAVVHFFGNLSCTLTQSQRRKFFLNSRAKFPTSAREKAALHSLIFHSEKFLPGRFAKWKNENDENFSPWLLVGTYLIFSFKLFCCC